MSRRIVVVDDDQRHLEAHCSWLAKAGYIDVTPLDFQQALVYRDWSAVQTLVVDGFDELEDPATQPGWLLDLAARKRDPVLPYDRYLGPRVVRAARRVNRNLVVIVVSGYVDKSPDMVERFHEAGANYIYSHNDTRNALAFVKAVITPDNRHTPTRAAGPAGRLQAVLDLLAGSRSEWDPRVVAAARMILVNELTRDAALRRTGVRPRDLNHCMDYIKDLLKLASVDTGGRKSGRKPRLEIAVEKIRRILGKDIAGPRGRTAS